MATGITITQVGAIVGDDVSVDALASTVTALTGVIMASKFAQGDILIALQKMGVDPADVLDMGMSEGTAINRMYVARNVPYEIRRGELSFAHHYLVAKLSREDQEEFLELAVQNEWKREELDHAINGTKLYPTLPPSRGLDPVRFVGKLSSLVEYAVAGGADEELVKEVMLFIDMIKKYRAVQQRPKESNNGTTGETALKGAAPQGDD